MTLSLRSNAIELKSWNEKLSSSNEFELFIKGLYSFKYCPYFILLS